MSEKKYYWMKFQREFFKSLRIKKLRRLAGGDTYTIIYLKLQLLSLSSDGYLYYKHIFDSFAEELAEEIDESVENIQVTLNFLMQEGVDLMLQDGDTFFLPYAAENMGSEGASAHRVRDFRERQRLEALQCNAPVTEVKRLCNVEKEIEEEKEKDIEIEKNIVEYLNEKTGKNYKHNTAKTKACIKARLNEGFTLEDFKQVIDNKVRDWGRDSKMEAYLRPETLFGNKFEGYLNQGGGRPNVQQEQKKHNFFE